MEVKKILDNLGITALSSMQQQVVASFSRTGNDLVLLSPTGTGKTIAYLLCVVQNLNPLCNDVQAIVILPTRELCNQSMDVFQHMKTGLRGYASHGGRSTMQEHRELRAINPHIIFATPGKLLDHFQKQNILPQTIRYVVLDEFDKCLQMGFEQEMTQLQHFFPIHSRYILLSATTSDEINRFVRTSQTEILDYQTTDNSRLQSYICHIPTRDKLQHIIPLIASFGNSSTIIFVNYRESVERIYTELIAQGLEPAMLHGGMEQKDRERSLYMFMNGSRNILVATDIASRGLDFRCVTNILHYHVAETPEVYTHRVGRTARWDQTGLSIHLLGPQEAVPDYLPTDIPTYIISETLPTIPKPQMQTLYIGKGKQDKISKGDIVGFLCKNANMNATQIGRIDIFPRYAYVAVNRKQLQQALQTSGLKMKGHRVLLEIIK